MIWLNSWYLIALYRTFYIHLICSYQSAHLYVSIWYGTPSNAMPSRITSYRNATNQSGSALLNPVHLSSNQLPILVISRGSARLPHLSSTQSSQFLEYTPLCLLYVCTTSPAHRNGAQRTQEEKIKTASRFKRSTIACLITFPILIYS